MASVPCELVTIIDEVFSKLLLTSLGFPYFLIDNAFFDAATDQDLPQVSKAAMITMDWGAE